MLKSLLEGIREHHLDQFIGRNIMAYVVDRKPPPDWIVGLLADELSLVVRNFVDVHDHTRSLLETVLFVQRYVPFRARGSREKVARWLFPEAFNE